MAAVLLATTATKHIIFGHVSAPHTSVNALGRRGGVGGGGVGLGEGAVRHFSINADTHRKLILFCVRRATAMNAKTFIFIAALGTEGALITGFTQTFICRFKLACRRRRRVQAPFYPIRVSWEREPSPFLG